MTAQPDQRPLEAHVNLVKFPKDSKLSYRLDKATPWIATLLTEMNEDATDKSPEAWLPETELIVSLELMRKWTNETGEYLLVEGQITGSYAAEDVKTLASIMVPLDFPVKAVFLGEAALKLDEYVDADEAWLDSDTWLIYPYRKLVVDLAEMLHEQLFLHRMPYPSKDSLQQALAKTDDSSPEFSSEDEGDLEDDDADDDDDWDEDGAEFETDNKSRQ